LFSCKKEEPEGVLIRVRNASQYQFENINVSPNHHYSTLGIGQTSDYQSYEIARSNLAVTLTAQGEELGVATIADLSSPQLKPGRYTYVLAITKGNAGENRLTTSLE
jgi:hypothetical protein